MLTLCNYSEYGFAEKVVEGMSVRINSITIKVQARAFHASFELWQLQGNSLNPKWQRSDLRYTRVTDPKRGEVRSTFIPPPLSYTGLFGSCHDAHLNTMVYHRNSVCSLGLQLTL